MEQIAAELEIPVLEEFICAEEEAEAYAALDQAMQDGLPPEKVLLLSAYLMLADEARTAIRFIRETPGLDFVLETRQHTLEKDDIHLGRTNVPELSEVSFEASTPEETHPEDAADEVPEGDDAIEINDEIGSELVTSKLATSELVTSEAA